MTRRVLFVDDERHVLDGLRDRLRCWRHQWQMVFADGANEALAVLDRQPIDVIVTDLRMPGIDGAALLAMVRERHPEVTRIVLSGHAEREVAARAALVAHQFVAKPAERGVIEHVVERTLFLETLLRDPGVRRVVGRLSHLASAPALHGALQGLLSQETASARQVAEVIEQDPGVAAKVLQLVHSAFFGLPRQVCDIEGAVVYLGHETIRDVVLAAECLDPTAHGTPTWRRDLEALRHHAVEVGRLSARLAQDTGFKREAFIAGLLHDIGKFVLVSQLPERFAAARALSTDEGYDASDAERSTLGATHAEVGAYLLGIWGLPLPIIEAVAYHHEPARAGVTDFDALAATCVANWLVNERDSRRRQRAGVSAVDPSFLQSLGLLHRLDEWRAMAA